MRTNESDNTTSTAATIERLVLSDAKGWRLLVGVTALVRISSRRRFTTVTALSGAFALAALQTASWVQR